MEIKLTDFKQPLENNSNLITKNEEKKTNNFNSKLKEVNKKEKNPIESKVNEKMKEIKDTKDLIVVEEETPKKDEKILFQGMINLINIMPEIKEDFEGEELNLVENMIVSDILIETENPNDTEKLIDNLLEEPISLVNQDDHNLQNELSTETEAKVKIQEGAIPEELKSVKIPLEQKKLEKLEKIEESLVSEEIKLVNNKDQIIKDNLNEFENEGQNNSSKSERKFELIETSLEEKGSKIENNTFIPTIKEGVKFSVDRPTELEVELPIESKEVVQQIVQKVKFDLSQNKNEIKLSLKPEALGEMTMNIEVAKDGVIAKIMVDNHKAKEIIEGNLVQLKEGIKDTVLEIKTFEVFVGSGSDFDKHNSQQFNLKQNSKKIRIKKEDNKRVENYGDQLVDDRMNSMNIGLESSMNLQA